MPKVTNLDKQWQQLMSLCESEANLRRQGGHPKTLKLITDEILQLAGDMGFPARRIDSRDFRALREGQHIVGIVVD